MTSTGFAVLMVLTLINIVFNMVICGICLDIADRISKRY